MSRLRNLPSPVTAINATAEITLAQLAAPCAGCGRAGMKHPPGCPVAVAMCAADMVAQHGETYWRTRTAQTLHTLGEPRAHRAALVAHWTAVSQSTPATPSPVAMVWDAAEGVFYEYRTAVPATPPKRWYPEWWGQT